MVVRSYPAVMQTWDAASRMRASVRRRCSAREPGRGVVMVHSTGVDQAADPFYDRSMNVC
jgi:hypothetical protein